MNDALGRSRPFETDATANGQAFFACDADGDTDSPFERDEPIGLREKGSSLGI